MEEKLKESTAKNQYTAKAYTYADYLTWPEESPVELIEGIPHAMTAPTRLHQEIVGEVFRQIANYLVGKPCKTYVAPFDVRLADSQAEDEDIINVVQPDIVVVCDQDKVNDDGRYEGVPTLVVEVLSPSTKEKDLVKKLNLYMTSGIAEYWIVDLESRILLQYFFAEDRSIQSIKSFSVGDVAQSSIFEGLDVPLDNIFV